MHYLVYSRISWVNAIFRSFVHGAVLCFERIHRHTPLWVKIFPSKMCCPGFNKLLTYHPFSFSEYKWCKNWPDGGALAPRVIKGSHFNVYTGSPKIHVYKPWFNLPSKVLRYWGQPRTGFSFSDHIQLDRRAGSNQLFPGLSFFSRGGGGWKGARRFSGGRFSKSHRFWSATLIGKIHIFFLISL